MFQTILLVSGHRGQYTVTVMFLKVVQDHHPRYHHASPSVSPTLNVPALTGFLQQTPSAGFMVRGPPTTSWTRTRELTTTISPGTPTATVNLVHCSPTHLPSISQ